MNDEPDPLTLLSLVVIGWMLWALTLFSAGVGLAAEPMGPASGLVRVEVGSGTDRAPRNAYGFIYESGGFILTAYGVLVEPLSQRLLGAGESIHVRPIPETAGTPGADRFAAQIVGVEPTLGIAILHAKGLATAAPSKILRSGRIDEGGIVSAPAGLPEVFPDGSSDPAIGRVAGKLTGLNSKECYQESLTSTLYRVSIPLDPSTQLGAPIYDEEGEVLAIYTGAEPEAAAGHVDDPNDRHVLPIVLAQNIYDSLKQKKSLLSPWTGFSVRRASAEESRRFPTSKGYDKGIGIEYVWPGGPAERLGVQAGDLLLQFAHNRIGSVADFQKWLYLYGVGSRIQLVFLREGEHLVAEYTIEERPDWAKPR